MRRACHAEGISHDGTLVSYGDELFRVDFKEHTGTPVIIYGQTEVTRDLYAAREKADGKIDFNVEDVVIHKPGHGRTSYYLRHPRRNQAP